MSQAQQFFNNMTNTRLMLNRLQAILAGVESSLIPITEETPMSVISQLSQLIATASTMQRKLISEYQLTNSEEVFQNSISRLQHPLVSPYKYPEPAVFRHNREFVMRPGGGPTEVSSVGYTYRQLVLDLTKPGKMDLMIQDCVLKTRVAGNDTGICLAFVESLNKTTNLERLAYKVRTEVSSFSGDHSEDQVMVVTRTGVRIPVRSMEDFIHWLTDWSDINQLIHREKEDGKTDTPSGVKLSPHFTGSNFAPSEMVQTSEEIGTMIIGKAPKPLTIRELLLNLGNANKAIMDKFANVQVPNFKITAEPFFRGSVILLSASVIDDKKRNFVFSNEVLEQGLHSAGLWFPLNNDSQLGKAQVMLRRHHGDNSPENSIPVTDYRQFYEWLIELNSANMLNKLVDSMSVDDKKATETETAKKTVTLKELFNFTNQVRKTDQSENLKVPNFKIVGTLRNGDVTLHYVRDTGVDINAINVCNRLLTWLSTNKFLTPKGNLSAAPGRLQVHMSISGSARDIPLTDPADFFAWIKNQGK